MKTNRMKIAVALAPALILGVFLILAAVAAEAAFAPVTDIIDVPDEAIVGAPLKLTGTVVPADAGNNGVIWSVKDAGATGAVITGNALSAAEAGMVTVTATVKDNWAAVATGWQHTAAIKTDGSLWTWGWNEYGQLGNGTNTERRAPVRVGTENDWAKIAQGSASNHTIAIKTDGSLWAWGRNNYGQLGVSSSTNRSTPVRVGTENDWAAAAAGGYHTAAIKTDGSLWTWGDNSLCQLGDGTDTNRYTPMRTGTENDWMAVAAGYSHTVAIKTDGSLWAWGVNQYGELGNGANISSNTPIRVGNENDWAAAAAGWGFTIAIKTDKSLWTWGFNIYGQLGDGTTTNRSAPIRVGTTNDWAATVAGVNHAIAIKTDGSLRAWGYNSYEQLGVGANSNQNTPASVGTANDWTAGAAGWQHTVTIKKDGSLWAWGNNVYGQLGVGANLRSAPVRVGTDNDWGSYRIFSKDFNIAVNEAPSYNISLNPASDKNFGSATQGYGEQEPHSVTVNNVGNQITGELRIDLSGANASSFTLSKTTIPGISANGSDSFTMTPNTGLAAGIYEATVTVSGSADITPQSFNVSFTVNSSGSGWCNAGYGYSVFILSLFFVIAKNLLSRNKLRIII
ncbi:MAG: hypothetical protein FWF87_06440 [Synergistaceae bacterium]|nr:hypothetical protein [Synergistaceae bacterium]